MSNDHYPPKYILAIVRLFCKPVHRDAIEGDLIELYKEKFEQQGRRSANRFLLREVVLLFRPTILRRVKLHNPIQKNSPGMIKNYFKTAFRNLARQKTTAFINVFGLSVGIACFTLFVLYAVNEFNYDVFNRNAANIYRVNLWQEARGNEEARGMGYQPMPLGPAMKRDLPGVEEYVRFREGWGESFIRTGDKVVRDEISFADPSVFSVFSFPFISGSASALSDLHSLVLTEAAAKDLFGSINPIGQTLNVKLDDQFEPFRVTGVLANLPSNSSIQFRILGNFNYLATTQSGARRVNNWHQFSYQTFIKLKPESHLPFDSKTLFAFRKKYYPDEEEKSRKDGWKGAGPRTYFSLQPLRTLHTDLKFPDGFVAPVDPKTIWILLAIGAGVLLIACINFTTLSIGRSASRAKEVGIRKVIGGSKKSLIQQFLTEALMLTFISAIIGVLLAILLLPSFNELSGKELHFSITQFPQLTWMILAIVILVGLMAGSYPALVLSGFRPVQVLKTKIKLGGSNIFTRALVTFQFVLSAALIIATIIILQQLRFMESKYPGFNKENVVVVDASGVSNTRQLYSLFRQKLSTHPEIVGTASAELGIGGNEGWSQSMFRYNGIDRQVFEYFIDPDYLHVMDMKLIAGRNFEPGRSADTVNSVIINEEMMKEFGWTRDNVIGQRLKGYKDNEDDPKTPVVIGMVANFNFLSFSAKLGSQMFQQFNGYDPYKYFVRIRPGNPSSSLAILQATWNEVAPNYPLKYSFLDDNLDKFYKSESRWNSIVAWAAGICIFLACLGLFGLAALAAVNRTREIGIRKVLGASLVSVIGLMSKSFLRLIVLALLIATPIAWYFMNRWLRDYAYRIHIAWWVFAITGIVTIGIALLVISLQSLKTAMTNPAISLRTE